VARDYVARQATTIAIATVSEWLRLIDHEASPSALARAAAAPWSRTRGRPLASETTSISRQPTGPMPVPSALAIASLAAKRAASAWGPAGRSRHLAR
jgi:hypothetical protein